MFEAGGGVVRTISPNLHMRFLYSLFALLALTTTPAAFAQDATPDYVTSSACKTCHEDAYTAWQGSHHDWAWKDATDDTVLGNFDDVTFDHLGVESRFFKDSEAYFVNTEGPEGSPKTYPVIYTVGVEPLQQYLIESEPGRLQTLTVSWDTENTRWFDLNPDQRIQANDGMHSMGVFQNWNGRCAVCHSTGYEKNYDPATQTFESTWAEINVGCESCHGPGEAHVTWAGSGSIDTIAGVDERGFTFDIKTAPVAEQSGMCAACHARREALDGDSRIAGSDFNDDFKLALLRDDLYHPDGQILDEVYVYGSFLQSKMHREGVGCSDCHEPHSLNLIAEGNAVCTQCHSPAGNDRFPSLQSKTYDSPEHHLHTAGAECVACHMPTTTYMVVDPRRDHSFKIPRPDLTVAIGTPNACTGCHEDRSAQWAANWIKQNYPDGHWQEKSFATTFAYALQGDPRAAKELTRLATETSQPAIIRATALELLQSLAPQEAMASSLSLINDPEVLVRQTLIKTISGATPDIRAQVLPLLLQDRSRSVRIDAARGLIGIPPQMLPPGATALVQQLTGEVQRSMFAMADFPEGQMNLAGLANDLGNSAATQAALETALALDPHYAPGWQTLARWRFSRREIDQGVQALRDGIAHEPSNASLLQDLAMVLTDLQQSGEALEIMEKLAEEFPDNDGIHIDLAYVLERSGRIGRSEEELQSALELNRRNPANYAALIEFHIRQQAPDKARALAERMSLVFPSDPRGLSYLQQLR